MIAYVMIGAAVLYLLYRALVYYLHARKTIPYAEMDRLLLQKLNEEGQAHEKTGTV